MSVTVGDLDPWVGDAARRSLARTAVLALVGAAILASCLSVRAPAAIQTWTWSGDSFRSGTFQNVSVSSNGSIELDATLPTSSRQMVLDVGLSGADSVYARMPFVLKEPDGSYKMWYSGYDGARNRMLYATSADGIHWTKRGVILDVLTPPYYFDSVGGQSVLKIGTTYHMWFSAGYWAGGAFGFWAQLYHAASPDGANWTITGVVLPPNQSWDIGMTNTPWVLQDAHGTYWLYFSGWDGTNTRIGVATSQNGTWFTPYANNPAVNLGVSGSWDGEDVLAPAVYLRGSTWTMYYSGTDRSTGRIGIATSADGLNWTKDARNPVMGPESYPYWDDQGVGGPDYVDDASGPRLYFFGSNGTYLRIGLTEFASAGAASYNGTYLSSTFSVGVGPAEWFSLSWNGSAPAGTSLSFLVRAGNGSVPDSAWTPWAPVSGSVGGALLSLPRTDYFQFRIDFFSSNVTLMPSVGSVTLAYAPNTGPEVFVSEPALGAWTSASQPLIRWIAADPQGDALLAFDAEVSQDPGFSSVFAASGPLPAGATAWQIPFALTDGTWYWRVQAEDAYGAWGNWTSGFLRVDTVAPSISVSSPAPNDVLHTSSADVMWSSSDIGSGLDHFDVSVDGATPIRVQAGNATAHLGGLSDGFHTITVRAVDRAGNVGAASVPVRVDTNILSLTGPDGIGPILLLLGAVIGGGALVGIALALRLLSKKP